MALWQGLQFEKLVDLLLKIEDYLELKLEQYLRIILLYYGAFVLDSKSYFINVDFILAEVCGEHSIGILTSS